LDLIQDDPHQWSARPCSTCQTISTLTERPFGCMKYKIDREKSNAKSIEHQRLDKK